MTRDELRHLIRAACRATGEQQVIVVGSQAVLASWREGVAPVEATMSNEADLAFFVDPDEIKADTVMGVLGLDSTFHVTFGVYADGVSSDSPVLPEGWQDRLIPLVVNDGDEVYVGWCLDPTDLCASKMAAGRAKDHQFVEALIRSCMVDPDVVAAALSTANVEPVRLETARALLAAWRPSARYEGRRSRIERSRRDAERDLRAQCPFPRPPAVEPPLRCGASTPNGPCRQPKQRCTVHASL